MAPVHDTSDRASIKIPWRAKQHRVSFLDLPREIRDQIYGCFYIDMVVEVTPAASKHHRHHLRTCTCLEPKTELQVRHCSMLGKNKTFIRATLESLRSPLALVLTCRTIAYEATSYLYAGTQIHLETPKRIIAFIGNIPTMNLARIKVLSLRHSTYGNPSDLADVQWKRKADAAWTRACLLASKSLPGLEELSIKLGISDTPFRLKLREAWVQPLLKFNTEGMPLLTKVRIELRNPPFSVMQVRYPDHDIARGCTALLGLFGAVIQNKIMGQSDEEATETYRHMLATGTTGVRRLGRPVTVSGVLGPGVSA